MEETTLIIDSRAKARDYVFGLLFAKAFASDEASDVFFAKELENTEVEYGTQIDYIRKVFFGVNDRLSEIDGRISEAAVGWSLSRLSKASLTIMRICIFEMLEVDDVPKRVALNEAVELAKKYDDDKASRFINGVLNNISRSLPERECDK